MRYISLTFWVVVVILGAIFAIQNSQSIKIYYYFGHSEIYFPLLLLLLLAFGTLLGACAILPIYLKKSNTARKLRYKDKQLEQEVNNLRTIPIKDNH